MCCLPKISDSDPENLSTKRKEQGKAAASKLSNLPCPNLFWSERRKRLRLVVWEVLLGHSEGSGCGVVLFEH
jgi:hypothetical protein